MNGTAWKFIPKILRVPLRGEQNKKARDFSLASALYVLSHATGIFFDLKL
jgi:hypothetical protein